MDDLDEFIIMCASAATAFITAQARKRKRTRQLWSEQWLLRRHEKKGILYMLENELKVEDAESYRSFLRMCEQHFDELLSLIQSDISRQDTNMREAVSPSHR